MHEKTADFLQCAVADGGQFTAAAGEHFLPGLSVRTHRGGGDRPAAAGAERGLHDHDGWYGGNPHCDHVLDRGRIGEGKIPECDMGAVCLLWLQLAF